MAPFHAPEATLPEPWPSRLLLLAGVVAALYLGRDVLAPLALALLLTIAVLPLVAWLERRRLPRVVAVLLVLLVVVGAVLGLVVVVGEQVYALATDLPRYETVLRAKLAAIGQGSGPIDGIFQLVARLGRVLAPPEAAPVPQMVVAAAPATPLGTLLGAATVVLAPAATMGLTLLLMAFILLQREDLRDRVLRLAGLNEMHRTTRTMADATSRLGRYLLMQLVVNGMYGLAMAGGLLALGVPNAPLWGVLGFALRFVPYLGGPLSALFPLLIAFATTEGWGTVLLVLVLFLIVDGLVSYVVEPLLYAASTGIAPLALLLASAVWALLWGPIGLILAPALTACLVILGRHVPGLAWLDVLLGDSEPLPPPARFYQRLLAEDASGAARLLAEEGDRLGAQGAVEQLVLPAVTQLANDRPGENFSAAMAVGAARALLQALERAAPASEPGAQILVLPLAGALDQAAAAAVLAVLLEAGHAASMRRDQAPAPELTLLVAATAAAPHRIRAALAAARRAGAPLQVLALTDAARQAMLAAEPGAPLLPDLATLLTRLEHAHPTAPSAVPEAAAA